MNKVTKIIFSFLFLLPAACTTAQFAPSQVTQTYEVRTAPDSIQLFRSALPTKKFIEIGAVTACCSTDESKMVDLLKVKASESGGDALTGLDVNAQGTASASVIRFK